MVYIVNGIKVGPNGVPLTDKELATLVEIVEVATDVIPADSPFAELSPAVQKSLAEAGITTLEQAKALGRDGLIALDGIGEVSADKILAL